MGGAALSPWRLSTTASAPNPSQRRVRPRRSRGETDAAQLRELQREIPHTTGCTVNDECLAGLQMQGVVDPLDRREPGVAIAPACLRLAPQATPDASTGTATYRRRSLRGDCPSCTNRPCSPTLNPGVSLPPGDDTAHRFEHQRKWECLMLCGCRRRPTSNRNPGGVTAINTSSAAGFGTGSVWSVMTSGPPARSIAAACIVCGQFSRPVPSGEPGLKRHTRREHPVIRMLALRPHLILSAVPAACLRAVSSAARCARVRDDRACGALKRSRCRAPWERAACLQARPRHQGDAVDGAWRTHSSHRTQRHQTVCICWWARRWHHRAGWEALGAADAGLFVDSAPPAADLEAVGRIRGNAGRCSKAASAPMVAGRPADTG